MGEPSADGPEQGRPSEGGERSQLRDGLDRTRIVLWLVTAIMLAVLAYVSWRYVGTIILGIFLYYVTRPVFDWLQSHIPGRTVAAGVAILAIALPVLVLLAWTLAITIQQLSAFVESAAFEDVGAALQPYIDASGVVNEIDTTVRNIVESPGQLLDAGLGDAFGNVFDTLLASIGIVANAGIHLFIVLVITFFLLRDDYRIAGWARNTFVEEGGAIDDYFVAVDRDLKNVYFGNILNAFVTGILGAVTYNVVNSVAPAAVSIPQPTLLGLLTGAASLVPVIGMKLVWVPVALYLFARSLISDPSTAWFPVVFSLVSVVIVDTIPDQLLRPYVSGRTLHVGAVMLAYILGPLLFGWYGIFLGPFILVIIVEFARIVVPWLVDPTRERPPPTPMSEAGEPVETPGESDEDAAASDEGDEATEDVAAPGESVETAEKPISDGEARPEDQG